MGKPGASPLLPALAIALYVLATPDRRVTADGDPLMHATIGREIVQTHSIPATDPFLLPLPGHVISPPFVDTEWAWDVLSYGVFNTFGFPGLVVLCAMLTAITFGLLYKLLERFAGPTLALTLTALTYIATDCHLACRPHLVTWLGLVIGMWLVELATPWWTFSLLAAAWVNFHGGAVIGAVVLAAYALWQRRSVGTASTAMQVFLAMTLGLLVNPAGPAGIFQVVTVLSDTHTLARTNDFAAVWTPGSVALAPFLLLAGLAILTWAIGGDLSLDLLWIVVLLSAAGQSGRNVPVAALLLAPGIALWCRNALVRYELTGLQGALRTLGQRWIFSSYWPALILASLLILPTSVLVASPPLPLGATTADTGQPVVNSVEAPWLLWQSPGRRLLIYPLTADFPSEAAERMDLYLDWSAHGAK